MHRVILVALSDTHGGNKLGLMPPDVVLHQQGRDGKMIDYSPEPTDSQLFLWEKYQEWILSIKRLAGNDEVVIIHNGDLTHGNKYPVELVSTRMSDQISIACSNLSRLLDFPNVKMVRLTTGTGAHNFGEGSADFLVGDMLQTFSPENDIETVYHGLLDIDGYIVDYAHHGPGPGIRDWLRGNVARFYLRDIVYRELRAGKRPPNLILRAHVHTPVFITEDYDGFEVKLMVTPPMCFLSDHARQFTQSTSAITVGMAAFEIVDGKLMDTYRFYETVELRTRETV